MNSETEHPNIIILKFNLLIFNLQDLGTWKPKATNNGTCGKRVYAQNIIGGSNADLGEFPYMAMIGKYQGYI